MLIYLLLLAGFILFLIGTGYLIYSYLQTRQATAPVQTPESKLPSEVPLTAESRQEITTIEQIEKLSPEQQIAELERLIEIYKSQELPYFKQKIREARIKLNFAREKTRKARYYQDGPPMPGSTLSVADAILSRELKTLNNLISKQDIRKQELFILETRLDELQQRQATESLRTK